MLSKAIWLAAIVDELRPGGEDRLVMVDPVASEAGGHGLDHLDMGGPIVAPSPSIFSSRAWAGVEDARK